LTLACGSGSCASVVVGLKKQLLLGKVRVKTEGGILMVDIRDGKVMKDGPA
jgi:diaminopimelate epimerase